MGDARLPPQDWMALAPTRAVLGALRSAGGADAARFVGGCVRDALLGRVAPGGAGLDIDIATPLPPAEVVAALEAAGLRAVPTGIEHGTVTAIADGRPYEVTTLRRDVETDGRRAVVAFTTDWREDAARRDFRLNALYADPEGRLYDPTGAGVDDARAGRIVFVGDPATRIREDHLRILRFFRFLAWYGREGPDAAGLAACAAGVGGIAALSGERVRKELLRLLAAADPLPAVAAMAEAGVLAACAPGLPPADDGAPLARLGALAQIERDGGEAGDALLRLRALLPGDAPALARAAARLRLSNAERDRLLQTAGAPGPAPGPGEGARRRAVHALGPARARDLARLARASGVDGEGWAAVERTAREWALPAFPVSGDDVLAAGAAPGPEVGRALQTLRAWWADQDFTPDRAALLARLAALLAD